MFGFCETCTPGTGERGSVGAAKADDGRGGQLGTSSVARRAARERHLARPSSSSAFTLALSRVVLEGAACAAPDGGDRSVSARVAAAARARGLYVRARVLYFGGRHPPYRRRLLRAAPRAAVMLPLGELRDDAGSAHRYAPPRRTSRTGQYERAARRSAAAAYFSSLSCLRWRCCCVTS